MLQSLLDQHVNLWLCDPVLLSLQAIEEDKSDEWFAGKNRK